MAKTIKIDSEKEYKSLLQKFAEFLSSKKFTDGRVNFSTDIGDQKDRKCSVTFSGAAWMKMNYLISVVDTQEVGWYCTARRGDDEQKDEYFIDDILIYPQQITGATVTEDTNAEWTNDLPDDVFRNMKAHGHSHVNFSCNPSPTDLHHQDEVLSTVRDDSFFIFFIYNKKGESNFRIFDYKKNVRFDTDDVEVYVEEDGGFFDFIEEVPKKIKKKTTYAGYAAGTGYGTGYGSSYGYGTGAGSVTTTGGGSFADKGKKSGGKKGKSVQAFDDYDDEGYDYPFGLSRK